MSEVNLKEANLWYAIYSQSTPMLLGISAIFSISLVDTYFVGQLGTKELAALTFTFPVAMVVASLSSGLGAGTASIVSRKLGADDKDAAKRISSDSMLLSGLLILLISIVGFFTIKPLFSVLGAKGETLNLIESYMQIWYLSMPFLVIPMVANAIIRSTGNAKWPGFIMVCSALINIVLTPLFIKGYAFIPAFHIEGAAIATLIARIFTFVFAFYILVFKTKLLCFELLSLRVFANSAKEIASIALPAGAGSIVNPIAIGGVTALLAVYSNEVVAAFGVATRIESIATIPLFALSAAIGPIAGQNWAAGKKQRVSQAVINCYIVCVLWAAASALIIFFFAKDLSLLLASNAELADISSIYLYAVIFSIAGYGCVIVSAACFNALGKSTLGLAQYIYRGFILYLPLSWLATLFFDFQYVFYAIALSNTVSGICVVFFTLRWLKKADECDCSPTLADALK